MENNKIIIYQGKAGEIEIRMDHGQDTVWARQDQIAELFEVDRTVVTKHIRNILKTEELQKNQVCAKFAHTANDGKTYQVMFYNLDMILSIGYRTNSKNAIKFRQWSTARLKDYITKGYSINQKRLDELQKTIQIISEKSKGDLSLIEARGFLEIISTYTESFILLNQYDAGSLEIE